MANRCDGRGDLEPAVRWILRHLGPTQCHPSERIQEETELPLFCNCNNLMQTPGPRDAFPVCRLRRCMPQLALSVQLNTPQAPPKDKLEALENGSAGRKRQPPTVHPAPYHAGLFLSALSFRSPGGEYCPCPANRYNDPALGQQRRHTHLRHARLYSQTQPPGAGRPSYDGLLRRATSDEVTYFI